MSRSGRIRVLVVEEPRFLGGMIGAVLASAPDIEVVGSAADGRDAVDAVAALAPHVVAMDVKLLRPDGLLAVERIMKERPTPILVVSACGRRESAVAIRALELGAVDCVATPLPALPGQILARVRAVAGVRPIPGPARPAMPPSRRPGPRRRGGEERRQLDWTPCVVIAASTGGPAALLSVVPALPPDLPASVLVIQHMPAPYTAALAAELAARSGLAVAEAADGEWLQRGRVYVCPGSHDLTLAPGGRIVLHPPASPDAMCPSADLALMSVARRAAERSVAVILTGIGRDGTAGARAIRRAGGVVIAQDEATSVVYGMPRAAVEAGTVNAVVPIEDVVETLRVYVADIAAAPARERRAV